VGRFLSATDCHGSFGRPARILEGECAAKAPVAAGLVHFLHRALVTDQSLKHWSSDDIASKLGFLGKLLLGLNPVNMDKLGVFAALIQSLAIQLLA
jgi:hypothetical protein